MHRPLLIMLINARWRWPIASLTYLTTAHQQENRKPLFRFSCLMIERLSNLAQVAALFRSHPAVAILGPRQCGKTTLAQNYLAAHVDAVNGESSK